MIESIIHDYLIIDFNHPRPIPLRNNGVLTLHPDHQGTWRTTALAIVILHNDRVLPTMLSLGARGGARGQNTANTLQGHGRCTDQKPTQHIVVTF